MEHQQKLAAWQIGGAKTLGYSEPMVEVQEQSGAAAEFQLALESLRQVKPRSEVEIVEIPAPADLAKHAVAFACNTKADGSSGIAERGTGRMVVLWDTAPQEAWSSRFRVIIFSKAPMDNDIGQEDLSSSELTWLWLKDALAKSGATYDAEAGTATRIASKGFGSLDTHRDHFEVELRASWSPSSPDLGAHLNAWQNLVCIMAGHAPHSEDVGRLDTRV